MGRGRAKAKQAKVARKLKYQVEDMDLDSLQRELKGEKGGDAYQDDYSEYSDWEDWEDKPSGR